jgi:hypothetical protein
MTMYVKYADAPHIQRKDNLDKQLGRFAHDGCFALRGSFERRELRPILQVGMSQAP